ncbi:MAG: DUF1049 domain-containing protein [Alphaproteobacteria bacterium]
MKLLNWAFVLALAAIAVSFALSNDQVTELALWPAPYSVEVPVYGAVMAAFVIGFFSGGLVVWLGRIAARHKRRGRTGRDEQDTAGTEPASGGTAMTTSTPSLPATGR